MKIRLTFLLIAMIAGVTLFAVMSTQGQAPVTDNGSRATSLPAAQQADLSARINPFAAFNFGIDDRSVQGQVNLLQKLGYDGISTGIINTGGGVDLLRNYANVPAVASGQFRVYVVLWYDKLSQGYDRQWLDDLLVESAKLHAALWVVADGRHMQDVDATVKYLAMAADQCAAHGVQMVLYPHSGCVFQDTDEALDIRSRLNRPEVKVSLHVCHELKSGKFDKIADTARKAAPYLSLVTINGADTARTSEPGWQGSIMPLDEGNLDLRPLVTALKEIHYTGPIVLHTYGITEKPEDHLLRSRNWWLKLQASVNEDQPPKRD